MVIDNSGNIPRHVAASAKLLAPNAEHYIYISSISAYADNSIEDQDETAKLTTTDDATVETITERTFGPLKVLCERGASEAFAERTTIVQPGYIVGPDDPSGPLRMGMPMVRNHSGCTEFHAAAVSLPAGGSGRPAAGFTD